MESPIQPTSKQPDSKIESIEKEPKVEHLLINGNRDVIIKTSFPWRDATAYTYILIHAPTPRTYDEVITDHYPEGMSEETKRTVKSTFETMNHLVYLKV